MSEFVTLEVHTNPWDAHITRGLLESEGIPVLLQNEHQVWANWPFSLALGGVQVQVPANALTRATAILNRRNSGEYQQEVFDIPATGMRCASCGGTRFTRDVNWGQVVLALVTLYWSSVIFPPRKGPMKCADCGGRPEA
ncbi:hypothetical protein CDO44_12345 [Pigmentiphaga sp. NML080357]|uniref:putative signal transducing protein n=1 Tax=Pigmentiphaga sp. NML080357 TaxID=2008675 RepID=UPI000B42014A|nr:DUF2007 domain-containing protein [Pigmentiphaga sp. NML080357]OVZ59395.1 hypothetical protein CDO44_12345 [Pigmentiphaga sp. NML080357]